MKTNVLRPLIITGILIGVIAAVAVARNVDQAKLVEETIELASVPAAVTAGAARDFPDAAIREVERLTCDADIWYELELIIDGVERDVLYSVNGIQLEFEDDDESESKDEDDTEEDD